MYLLSTTYSEQLPGTLQVFKQLRRHRLKIDRFDSLLRHKALMEPGVGLQVQAIEENGSRSA